MWNRTVLGLLVALNIFLVYRVVWSDNGLLAYLELQSRYNELEHQVQELNRTSLELSQEIRLLKSDRAYIEKMIRQQMNFVKEDEILYVFPDTPPHEPPGAAPDGREN
jgi:cell division protein FtsB/cell division protein DivIC